MRLVWQLGEGVMSGSVAQVAVGRLRGLGHVRQAAQEVRIGVAHSIGQRGVRRLLAISQGHRGIGIVHAAAAADVVIGRHEAGDLRWWTHGTGHGRGGGIATTAPGELLAVAAHRQWHRAAVSRIVELLLRHRTLQRQRGTVDDHRRRGGGGGGGDGRGIRIEAGHAHVGAPTVGLLLNGRLWWAWRWLAVGPRPYDDLQLTLLARMDAAGGLGGGTLRRRGGVGALGGGGGVAAGRQRLVGNPRIGAAQTAGCGTGGDLGMGQKQR